MSHIISIIKRNGNRPNESYSEQKLRSSIVRTCMSAGSPEGQAEKTADLVCKDVAHWLEIRHEVTSQDIRLVASRSLKKHHPEAAYLYEQHRITI
jgi:transcriptional regulator NrdR family protein